MILTVPYPPSANRYWRRHGHTIYLSNEARQYKESVKLTMRSGPPIQGKVRVTARLYRPAKRGDMLNREKVLMDALEGVAFVDDSQIWEAHFYQFDDKVNPRAEVEVERIGE